MDRLCDVNLVDEDNVSIPAHKLVLSASSEYLLAQLTKPGCSLLNLNLNGKALEIAVQYMYHEETVINSYQNALVRNGSPGIKKILYENDTLGELFLIRRRLF